MMKCPRCVQNIHRAAESCPHCGYAMADADANFGADDVRMRLLTDQAGIFRRGDRGRVERALDRMARRFPQLFVAIFTGSLGELSRLRQFGFWLLNRAAFEDLPADKPNEAGILLTIDPESKAAGIVFGYLLDPYLDERDTFECLSRAHAYWLEGLYTEGVLRALAHLEVVLKKRSRQARRDPEQFMRRVLPRFIPGDRIREIRKGHRVPSGIQAATNSGE
jgi:hypothetical protein